MGHQIKNPIFLWDFKLSSLFHRSGGTFSNTVLNHGTIFRLNDSLKVMRTGCYSFRHMMNIFYKTNDYYGYTKKFFKNPGSGVRDSNFIIEESWERNQNTIDSTSWHGDCRPLNDKFHRVT